MASHRIVPVLLVSLLGVLALYIWLARYVHPFADDWSYAVAGMRTELLPRLWDEYHLWNGRYFSNILVLRGPMVLGLERGLTLYRLVPVVLMLLTWAGAYAFIRAITANAIERGRALLGGLLFVVVFLNVMPDLSEGVYWYTGSVTYQLANALSLFVVACWAVVLRSAEEHRPWHLIAIALLTVVIIGSNELHMVFIVLLHGALLAFQYRSSGRVHRALAALLLLSLLCAAVVYLAPGNEMRGGQFPERQRFFHSMLWGAIQTGRFLLTWIFSPALLLLSVLYIPIGRWLSGRVPLFADAFGLKPWMALVIVVVPVYLAMALPYWSTGMLGQHRTVNTTLFCFIPLWLMALTVLDTHIFQKRGLGIDMIERGRTGLCVVLLISLLFTRSGGAIVSDIANRRLVAYDTCVREHYDLIKQARDSGAGEVIVPEVADPPHSLHVLLPGADPAHWANRSLAHYFNADAMEVRTVPVP